MAIKNILAKIEFVASVMRPILSSHFAYGQGIQEKNEFQRYADEFVETGVTSEMRTVFL